MGNAKTRREASRLFDWCLKTLFSKEDALISLSELQWELKQSWENAVEQGIIEIKN